jgi:glycosyltransferase involved in cell wall biosynthesis
MNKHIALIGFNYQPRRHTGDKNFWVELIPLLAKKLEQITIFSIRRHPNGSEEQTVNGCHLSINYIRPRFLETPDGTSHEPRMFWKGGAFPHWLGVIEKQMSILRLVSSLKSIHRKNAFGHIHLMDNMGPGNILLAKFARSLGCSVSVSALSYQGSNPFFYDRYLRLSYNAPNLSVIPCSRTFGNKLLELGVPSEKVVRIPWGVYPGRAVSSIDKSLLKKALGFSDGRPLILWAGYIQQIQRKDFLFALEQAKAALSKGLEATFCFAFKPESLETGFEKFHQPGDGVHVMTSDVTTFARLKDACDFLYSPIVNRQAIIAPPLTWVEIMAKGTPILTTNVGGAMEIVEDGKTGYAARGADDLRQAMSRMARNCSSMQQACIEKVRNEYNIENSVEKYLCHWFEERR